MPSFCCQYIYVGKLAYIQNKSAHFHAHTRTHTRICQQVEIDAYPKSFCYCWTFKLLIFTMNVPKCGIHRKWCQPQFKQKYLISDWGMKCIILSLHKRSAWWSMNEYPKMQYVGETFANILLCFQQFASLISFGLDVLAFYFYQ